MAGKQYISHSVPMSNVKNLGGRPTVIDIDILKELHGAGLSDGEIADQLGVKRTTVTMARKRLGLAANRSRGGYHGSARTVDSEEDAAIEAWLRHVQAVNAAEMSGPKVQVGGEDWLKWAGNAYKLNSTHRRYIYALDPESKPADLPKQIPVVEPCVCTVSGFKKGKGGGRKPIIETS